MSPTIFIHFLLNPIYPPVDRKDTNFFSAAIKIYLLFILVGALAYTPINLFLTTYFTLPIDESFIIPVRYKDHLWIFFIVIAFIGPLIEEVIFRLSLVFKPVYISLTFATVVGLLSHKIFNRFNAFLIFLIIFLFIFQFALKYSSNLESFWKNHFKFFFYILPILFGLGHVFNYRYTDTSQYWIAPLIVFPQMILGFILSVTRLYFRKGFLLALLVHVLLNSIAMSIFMIHRNGYPFIPLS